MKKAITLLLVLSLLCGFTCIEVFATDTMQSKDNTVTEYVENIDADKQAVHEHGSECEVILPDQANYRETLPSTVIQLAESKDFSDVTFEFDESASSFVEKITDSNCELEGNVVTERDTEKDITAYFAEKQAIRFDIIDLAYQNDIISEYERISTYCEVYELGYYENVDCLHKIVLELCEYYYSDATPDYVKSEISNILMPPETNSAIVSSSSTRAYKEYQSTNYILYYVSDSVRGEVIKTANYLETIRSEYLSMGFREPIRESGYT